LQKGLRNAKHYMLYYILKLKYLMIELKETTVFFQLKWKVADCYSNATYSVILKKHPFLHTCANIDMNMKIKMYKIGTKPPPDLISNQESHLLVPYLTQPSKWWEGLPSTSIFFILSIKTLVVSIFLKASVAPKPLTLSSKDEHQK
jgi:hypothetical protein